MTSDLESLRARMVRQDTTTAAAFRLKPEATLLNSRLKPEGTLLDSWLKPEGTLLDSWLKPEGTLLNSWLKPEGTLLDSWLKPEGTLLNSWLKPEGTLLDSWLKPEGTLLDSWLKPEATLLDSWLPALAGRLREASRRGAAIALGAMLLAAITACKSDPPSPATPAAPVAVQIGPENVVTVTTQDISTGPLISGTLAAEKDAKVRSEVSGSILQVTAAEGQNVRRGALLARVEDQALGDAYKSAQSAVKSAEQALGVAEREAARTESLVKGGALAERELDVARNAVTAAQAQVEDARSRVAAAAKQLANLTIRSPLDGVVAERSANAGDVVTPGTELYHIIDPRSMQLEASVPSESLSIIKVGLPVQFEVRGYPGQPFTGRIARISPAADPVTRQVSIFVTIPNVGGRLVAGLFAEGRVAQQARRALVVPLTAVNTSDPKAPWVLRVAGGKAERVTVTLGLRDDQTERVEISSGVKEGDRLLVGPAQAITPGTPLELPGTS